MKKLRYLAAALCLPALTHAQNGFYLSASGGAGITNASKPEPPGIILEDKSAFMHYSARLNAGYQMNRWRFQTGIQYFTSGFKRDLVFGNDFNPATPDIVNPSGDQRVTFHHIGIPVQVGYALPLGNRLKLVPTLGLLTTYNISASMRTREGSIKHTSSLTGADFSSQYNRISFWGTAAVHLEYRLSNKVSLFGGPSANYMIGNLAKPSVNSGFSYSQRNYTIGFELGIKLEL
ncbi:outer membrane beta-barrel protein [Taibaiella helva]|uniref:outer membrane beta-barrel protein n=1 Tax=Taibaiella helva TaxID=2301235 RepID=UPI000E56F351|nr:outer membrane beta-barrel protein [Taibaiella helva]